MVLTGSKANTEYLKQSIAFSARNNVVNSSCFTWKDLIY